MLFHVSIAARDPQHVATVLAELMQGEALPFPPVSDDGWIAFAGDAHGTAVEVYPLGTMLHEAPGDADAIGLTGASDGYTATHAALGVDLEMDAIMAIASREGWPTKYRKRGGAFGVMEMWIEGRQMMELLTPAMQAEYKTRIHIEGWRTMLAMAG